MLEAVGLVARNEFHVICAVHRVALVHEVLLLEPPRGRGVEEPRVAVMVVVRVTAEQDENLVREDHLVVHARGRVARRQRRDFAPVPARHIVEPEVIEIIRIPGAERAASLTRAAADA